MTPKTGVMTAKSSALPSQEYIYIYIYIFFIYSMYSIFYYYCVTTFKINKNLTNPKLEGWCKMYFTEYSLEQHEGE